MTTQQQWLRGTFYASLMALLTACGGGSDDDSAAAPQTETPPTAQNQASSPSPDPQSDGDEAPTAQTTADLAIDADFTLDSQRHLALSVSLPEAVQRPYLRICQLDSNGEVLQSRCLWQGELSDSALQLRLQVGPQHAQLAAQLWDLAQLDQAPRLQPLAVQSATVNLVF